MKGHLKLYQTPFLISDQILGRLTFINRDLSGAGSWCGEKGVSPFGLFLLISGSKPKDILEVQADLKELSSQSFGLKWLLYLEKISLTINDKSESRNLAWKFFCVNPVQGLLEPEVNHSLGSSLALVLFQAGCIDLIPPTLLDWSSHPQICLATMPG